MEILECLKIGSITKLEPREVKGQIKYEGNDRFRWHGQDQKDRALRLIVIIDDETIVVSAAEANPKAAAAYLTDDAVVLADLEDNDESEDGG